jgi:hypothetical protein
MRDLHANSLLAASLSVEQIAKLTDEEILDMAMERPGNPGQFGFILDHRVFRSMEHHGQTLVSLMQRLGKVESLKETVKSRNLVSAEDEAKPDIMSDGGFQSFIPNRLVVEHRPDYAILPLNVLYGRRKTDAQGRGVILSTLYEPDLSTFQSNGQKSSMTYRPRLDPRYHLVITHDATGMGMYTGVKYRDGESIVHSSGPTWDMFFAHLTMLGPDAKEKSEFSITGDDGPMQVATPEEFAKAHTRAVGNAQAIIESGGDIEKQKTCKHPLDSWSGDLLHGPCVCADCGAQIC